MGFERVTVAAAGTPASVTFRVGANQLGLVDENGNTQLVAGKHSIEISNGTLFTHSLPHSHTRVPKAPTHARTRRSAAATTTDSATDDAA